MPLIRWSFTAVPILEGKPPVAPSILIRYGPLRRILLGFPFKNRLQCLQVGFDHPGVLVELVIGHAGKLKEGEHHFAPLAIGDDSHRIQNRLTIGQRDHMVENAEIIGGNEANSNSTGRRFHFPFAAGVPHRQAERGDPLGQVARRRGKRIDDRRRPVNRTTDRAAVFHVWSLWTRRLNDFPGDRWRQHLGWREVFASESARSRPAGVDEDDREEI